LGIRRFPDDRLADTGIDSDQASAPEARLLALPLALDPFPLFDALQSGLDLIGLLETLVLDLQPLP